MAVGVVPDIRDDDRGFRRLLLVAMAFGFAALIGAAVATWWSTAANQRHNDRVDHTYQVLEAISDFQIALEQSETARRGYILSGSRTFLDTYRANSAALQPRLERVVGLTIDNAKQRQNIARLLTQLERVQAARNRSMRLTETGAFAGVIATFETDGVVWGIRAVRTRLAAMVAEEKRLLALRTEQQRRGNALFLAILTAAGLLIVAVAAISTLTMLRYTRDLGATGDRLRVLNTSLEDRVTERTADLSRANEEIQRFAYIVSHDLRSPLVNVMGFTAELESGVKAIGELVDRAEETAPDIVTAEARDAAREDLPEAIGFIRTSTAKMDRLIGAILKLSREGRRVITPEPLDMETMASGIRDTLQHRLDEKGAEIVVEAPLPPITSDRLAIDQVFANVIENAVKYLDPKRPGRIVVSGTTRAGRAIFEIADNGRGIDPRDHARVFDLFRRSGAQDQPGEGIGLAHVRALTYRLGGTIDVASTLGEGATFRINLPITYVEPTGTPQ